MTKKTPHPKCEHGTYLASCCRECQGELERLKSENERLQKLGKEFIWGEENPHEYESEMSKLEAENERLRDLTKGWKAAALACEDIVRTDEHFEFGNDLALSLIEFAREAENNSEPEGLVSRFESFGMEVPYSDEEAKEIIDEAGIDSDVALAQLMSEAEKNSEQSITAQAHEFATKLERLPAEIRAMSGVPGDVRKESDGLLHGKVHEDIGNGRAARTVRQKGGE